MIEKIKKKIDWFFLKIVFHSVPTMIFFFYLQVFAVFFSVLYIFLIHPLLLIVYWFIFVNIIGQGPKWSMKLLDKIKNKWF